MVVGLHDILNAIITRISVKLFRSSLTSYAIHAQNRDIERNIALLASELQLCVLNAAPFENRLWRFINNHRTGFTDEMRITIAFNISCRPSWLYSDLLMPNVINLRIFSCVKTFCLRKNIKQEK